MRPLCDVIEAFIKELMAEENAEQAEIELKRNELAEYFRCAPSQINYVLATRFTPNRGYIIESRRGGGGYIRIIRVAMEADGEQLLRLASQGIGDALGEQEAKTIIADLRERNVIDAGQAQLMRAATSASAISLPLNIKDALRAAILRSMVLALAQKVQEG